MRKKLLNNLGLKIISLVLAFLLWFMVVQTTDPKDDKDIGTIPVKLVNADLLDKQNKVYEILDNTDTVRVTVFAPRSVLKSLRSSDILAEADVSKLTDINTVPITFSSVNVDTVDIKGGHDVVRLSVEDKESKYVSLVTNIVGETAEGYIVSSLTPDQNRIEVSGPKSVVEKVKYAGAMIDVTDSTSNLFANVDIRLYDADGNPVEHKNLVKNVDYVRLSVEVLAVKEVPVKLEVGGEPPEGYMMTGVIECDPSVIRIAGSSYALSRINEIVIPEERLDISQKTESLAESISVHDYLPDGIKLADNDFNGRVNVTVAIEAVAERTLRISPQNISVKNLPEDLDYEIEIAEPEEGSSYSLEIKGLRDRIYAIGQDNVFGTVDMKAWMEQENVKQLRPGTYTIPITVVMNDDIMVGAMPEARVIVRESED